MSWWLALVIGAVSGGIPAAVGVGMGGGTTIAATPETPINVGDRLRYQVVEDGDGPVELVVSNTGMVDLPYFGPLMAAGASLADLRMKITEALEADLYIKATLRLSVLELRLSAVNRGRVHLAGQVRRIGPVDIDMGERNTLGRVILASGGLAEFADDRRVRVIRRDAATDKFETIVVDLREVLDRGRIDKDIDLQDGDFVIVDERLIKW